MRNKTDQKKCKFGRTIFAQILSGCHLLLLQDEFVFIFSSLRFQPLPRKITPKKIYQRVGQRFKIIASTARKSKMIIDGRISRSSSKGLMAGETTVLLLLHVHEPFRQAKINAVDTVFSITQSNYKIMLGEKEKNEFAFVK